MFFILKVSTSLIGGDGTKYVIISCVHKSFGKMYNVKNAAIGLKSIKFDQSPLHKYNIIEACCHWM